MKCIKRAAGAAFMAGAAAFAPMGAASAADMPEVIDATTAPFDIAFGVKGTTEWVLRGITQTDGEPAVQGYAELQAFGWVYAGIWASNVNFGGASDPAAEIDYYGGVRHSWGPLTLDAGYVWVDFSGGVKGVRQLDYGKVYGIVKYAVTENFEIGGNVYYGGDFINLGAEIVHATASAKYKFNPLDSMPDIGFYVSGSFSRQWVSKNFSPDYNYWDAGAGLTYKAMTLDFRYSDTNLKKSECFGYMGNRNWCGDSYVVSLAFDTSLSKLK
jgi:uncharacterized protein (TIGR02001 family)